MAVPSNELVTPDFILMDGLFEVDENTVFTRNTDRQYDSKFETNGGIKVGDSVDVRLPVRVLTFEGAEMQEQAVQERTVTVRVDTQQQAPLEFGSWSLKWQVQEYKDRYLDPCFTALAVKIDTSGAELMAKATSAFVGTPGVPPGSTGTLPYAATGPYAEGNRRLTDMRVPANGRKAMLTAQQHQYLTQGVQTLFNPVPQISAAYRTGQFANNALGIDDWYMTQSLYRHTVGALGGTPLTTGAGQTGAAIMTDGWTTAAATRLNVGDKITFGSVYEVDPLNPDKILPTLKQFTVTEAGISDGAGAMTIQISPAIVASGPYKNVSAAPADGAAILTFGHASTYANVQTDMGLLFHKGAYACATGVPEVYSNQPFCQAVKSKALGLAFRVWKGADIRRDSGPTRVDAYFGFTGMRATELAVVALG